MNDALARMKLEHYEKTYGKMTIEELLSLQEQTKGFLADLPPTDPAWEKFCNDHHRWKQYIACKVKAENIDNAVWADETKLVGAIGSVVFEFSHWHMKHSLRPPTKDDYILSGCEVFAKKYGYARLRVENTRKMEVEVL